MSAAAPEPSPRDLRKKKLYRRLAVALGLGLFALSMWLEIFPGSWRLHLYLRAKRAEMRLDGFTREDATIPAGSVVFLGSSTFQRFPLEETYPGKPAVNRGMGSETAMDLFMRLDRSMPVAPPAGVVILVGANDTRGDGIPVPCTLVVVAALLNTFAVRNPGMAVAFLEVMPILNDTPELLARIKLLNDGIEKLVHEHGAIFIHTHRPPLVDASGHGVEEWYVDNHHLNNAGYKIFAKWIADDGGAATAPLRDP